MESLISRGSLASAHSPVLMNAAGDLSAQCASSSSAAVASASRMHHMINRKGPVTLPKCVRGGMSITPLHGERLTGRESDTGERQGAFDCAPWRETALDIMLPLEKCGAVLTTSAQVRGQYFMRKEVILKSLALGKGDLLNFLWARLLSKIDF